jgi:hypothetical protein
MLRFYAYSYIDEPLGEVVVQTQSPAAMLGALLSVATARALEAKREQVPVAGSVLETPASSALLVPPPHEQAAPAVPPAQLHSAGHAILSSEGLTAAWRGFSARGLSEADWPLRRGDLVEEDAAGRPVRSSLLLHKIYRTVLCVRAAACDGRAGADNVEL